MDKNAIRELVKLADSLDKRSLRKEADLIDQVLVQFGAGDPQVIMNHLDMLWEFAKSQYERKIKGRGSPDKKEIAAFVHRLEQVVQMANDLTGALRF